MSSQRVSVLFVCTGNAGRSQMAEELFRRVAPPDTVVYSAGVEPWEHVHPMASRILLERGIDIRQKKPRHVRDLVHVPFGLVVTIGSPARDRTPDFPGQPVRIHWDIGDPADADGTADSEAVFRRTLDDIEGRLRDLLRVVRTAVPDVPPFSAGISTCVVRPGRFLPAKHLPLIARAGFSSIELNCYHGEDDFDWRSPQAVRELRSVCNSEGVRIRSAHAPGEYPRTHVDEAMARRYVETTKQFCDFAAELGSRVVVIHALKTQEPGPDLWDKLMRYTLDELAEHVLPLPVLLGLENLNWRVVPSEDLALVRSYSADAMGFVLDNGHAHLFGAIGEYLNLCGLRLYGVHISDNDGSKDEHSLPGTGTVQWKEFVGGLVRSGYAGPLTLEVHAYDRQDDLPGYLEDCASAVRMVRDLVAEEGPAGTQSARSGSAPFNRT